MSVLERTTLYDIKKCYYRKKSNNYNICSKYNASKISINSLNTDSKAKKRNKKLELRMFYQRA